jgi:hypothetical protein
MHAELTPLTDAHLVREYQGTYEPTFFIADKAETAQVTDHAKQISRELAEYCVQQWQPMQQIFEELQLEPRQSFVDLAFFLVGDMILDVGVLDSLARDRSLMPAAPSRPSPDKPNARYYFWMISGVYEQLGHYGQRATSLPWDHWHLLTFGQYEINNQPNRHRTHFEAHVLDRAHESDSSDALSLARALHLPAFPQQQAQHWTASTRSHADAITEIYKQHQPSIHALYQGLSASRGQATSFGEFFCWYHHITYPHAIDHLVARAKIHIPEQRYTAALWYAAPQGKSF